jgi:catechol 2,3-dioxygenase-like lactoylglutathione lyase family enzyme
LAFARNYHWKPNMIHHVSLGSNDIARAKTFYDPLMRLIGFRVLKASPTAVHYGASDIVFSLETPADGKPASAGNGVHVAFQAPDRETVRRFHALALARGGTDEGKPGIRPNYNDHYYGAFVRDPDGNKIEAVTYTARESFGLLLEDTSIPVSWRARSPRPMVPLSRKSRWCKSIGARHAEITGPPEDRDPLIDANKVLSLSAHPRHRRDQAASADLN